MEAVAGKQQAPARQRAEEACACGAARVRVSSATGSRSCKQCLRRAITARAGHLAVRVPLDGHSDGSVPQHGLSLDSGCKPVEHARFGHNCTTCGPERVRQERGPSFSCGLCCLHGKMTGIRPTAAEHAQLCKACWTACWPSPSFGQTFGDTMPQWLSPAWVMPVRLHVRGLLGADNLSLLFMCRCTMLCRRSIRLMASNGGMGSCTFTIQLRLCSSEWEHSMACSKMSWGTYIK